MSFLLNVMFACQTWVKVSIAVSFGAIAIVSVVSLAIWLRA
jgi:hypothetical protein